MVDGNGSVSPSQRTPLNPSRHIRNFVIFVVPPGLQVRLCLMVAATFAAVGAIACGFSALTGYAALRLHCETCSSVSEGATTVLSVVDCPTHRPFDRNLFWGGLWYRIGEAILFTLVFLLVIHFAEGNHGKNTDPDAIKAYDLWLPLIALMLGMFIKTGERLVFGLAERVFAAASSLIPIEPEMNMKAVPPEKRRDHEIRQGTLREELSPTNGDAVKHAAPRSY